MEVTSYRISEHWRELIPYQQRLLKMHKGAYPTKALIYLDLDVSSIHP